MYAETLAQKELLIQKAREAHSTLSRFLLVRTLDSVETTATGRQQIEDLIQEKDELRNRNRDLEDKVKQLDLKLRDAEAQLKLLAEIREKYDRLSSDWFQVDAVHQAMLRRLLQTIDDNRPVAEDELLLLVGATRSPELLRQSQIILADFVRYGLVERMTLTGTSVAYAWKE